MKNGVSLCLIYEVNDVNEAVELAREWKRSGRYDLFRGQQENWPLVSSYCRLTAEERERELETLASYENWVQNTVGLEYLRTNVDYMLAVAQHHGLKTNYVDFTTDPTVAGYFASENAKQAQGPSCILCLSTSDLRDFWKVMPPSFPPPELIYVDVPDLWRLEVQKGVFLFCQYPNFEQIYNLDRILFPPTETVSTPTHDEIYPPRKSNLEKLLDQWIMTVRLKQGTEMARKTIGSNVTWINLKDSGEYPEEGILAKNITKHWSWEEKKLEAWLNVKHEKHQEVKAATELELKIDIPLLMRSNRHTKLEIFAGQFVKRLENDKDIRGQLVHFKFGIRQPEGYRIVIDGKPLEKLWDGLRCLPYEDWEIAVGLANCAMLQIFRQLNSHGQFQDWEEEANQCFGETIEVEFGCGDGSYSRAFVSENDLFEAVRQDLGHFLSPEYRKLISSRNIFGLLQLIHAPYFLFDFRKLASLFAKQINPIQVLTREFSLFYSPARLYSFRLP